MIDRSGHRVRTGRAVAVVAALAGVAALIGWGVHDSLAALEAGTASLDQLIGLVAAAAAAATIGWLAVVVAVVAAASVRGCAGRAARHCAQAVAPAQVRALASVALGASLIGVAMPASALPAAGVAAAIQAGDERPAFPGVERPGVERPTGELPTPDGLGVPAPSDPVVVAPGDSLWAIAERHLGGAATAPAVAAEWPRWFAANRDELGPDPHLIQPGTALIPPPPAAEPSRGAR